MDLYDTLGINLTQPWWYQGYVENMTVGDSLYMATGSATLTILENMGVIFFNKQMIADNDLPDPYELVNSGKWTLDAVMEGAKAVTSDLNQNNRPDPEDRVDFFTYKNQLNAMQISLGLRFCEWDEEGYPYLTYLDDRMIRAFDALSGYMNTNQILKYDVSEYRFGGQHRASVRRCASDKGAQAPLSL